MNIKKSNNKMKETNIEDRKVRCLSLFNEIDGTFDAKDDTVSSLVNDNKKQKCTKNFDKYFM